MVECMDAEIGIIGGSGFYSMLSNPEYRKVESKYGSASDSISLGIIENRRVAFIPRHGSKHTIAPSHVPYLANIDSLRNMGVTRIIATNAVGSLKKEYKPGDIVFFDQFVNMTTGRRDTFFDAHEKFVHVSMADPYCKYMREVAFGAAERLGLEYHKTGTVVVIDGPRFSTRAESRFFSRQGFETINMTQYPEASLAREAELCYLGIGIVTDYDAGLEGMPEIKPVQASEVTRVFATKVEGVKRLISEIVKDTGKERNCECKDALNGAV